MLLSYNSTKQTSNQKATPPQNKNNYASLSLSGLPTQRNYFGSDHGKGEADGETGLFAQAVRRAISSGHDFENAGDYVSFGNTLPQPKSGDLHKRLIWIKILGIKVFI